MSQQSPHRAVFLAITIALIFAGRATSVSAGPNGATADEPETRKSKAVAQPLRKPAPPFRLPVPPAPPARLGDTDLEKMSRTDLRALIARAVEQKLYKEAAIAQYWYVRKSDGGQYDLACYLALTGQADPAFYWLQAAAIGEGVTAQQVRQADDLESLWRDDRWEKVLRYVEECNRYFESAMIRRTVVAVPKGYKKSEAIAAVVWLHGMGSRPDELLGVGQIYADLLNIAFIGVSGTKARGPNKFVWAEDLEQDTSRVRDAIAEVGDRVTIKKGHVIPLGFSQGAQVGVELAAKYPEEFAGAIAFSPGGETHWDHLKPSPLLARRGFVVSCGADEYQGTVAQTALDAEWLRRAKAQVIHKAYPGVSAHSFPEDFAKRFPEWIEFILKARKD